MAKGYSARGGFSGGGSAMRQQQMQQKLLKMQQDMEAAQEAVENASFTASVGGGVVQATVSGKKELTALTIKPEAVDPEDVEMLQDLVISAVNEALRQADEAMEQSMGAVTGGLNLGVTNLLDRKLLVTAAAHSAAAIIDKISHHIHNITHHCTGCRHLSCAPAHKHCIIHRIGMDKHRVKCVFYACKRMIFINQHRMYLDFNALRCVSCQSEQLDHIAEFFGITDIIR